MKISVVSLALAALAWCGSIVSHAASITVNPTSDGSLYTCDGCNVVSDGAYVLAAGILIFVWNFLKSVRNGSTSWNCRSSGKPPTLW